MDDYPTWVLRQNCEVNFESGTPLQQADFGRPSNSHQIYPL
jgi:hypothetical protein